MKEYHFERDDHDFDETIRLDDINEEIKRLKGADVDDELGDANAFLDAFESEKFDTPLEEVPAEAPEEEPEEKTKNPLPGRRVVSPGPEEEDWEEEERFGMSKRTIGLFAVLAVLACVLGFSFTRCGFRGSTPPAESTGQAFPMLVETVLNTEEVIVYDITDGGRKTLRLTEETEMTDEMGRTVAYGSVAEGDLAMMELAEDGETVLSVDYSGEAIQTREVTGLEVNTGSRTLSNGENSFAYGKEAIFLYDGEKMNPKDLEPCDVLLLKGHEDTVWSVEILEYHGYIVVENTDNIKDGQLQLEEAEPVPLREGDRIPVKEGSHQVTVTGSNIETRKDTIFVEAGEEFLYDLSKAQEKLGVVLINANVSDYRLYVNGTLTESPAVLPMGEYDLVILKNGYLEWSQHVVLDQDTVTVNAQLQQEVQTGTLSVTASQEGAEVYINGEKYGTAPLQVNLAYGSYTVQVEKEGFDTYRQVVSLNGPSATVYAEME